MLKMFSLSKKIRNRQAEKNLKAKQSDDALEEVALKLGMMKEHLTVHLIEIERICPSPLQREEESESDLRGLCDSIRRNGLLQPLAVRRVCKDCSSIGGIFTLISGSRRLAALKILGITKAPCVICDLPASAALSASASARIHQRCAGAFETAGYLEQLKAEQCLNAENAAVRLSLPGELGKRLEKMKVYKADERKLALSAGLSDAVLLRIAEEAEDGRRRRSLARVVAAVCDEMKEDKKNAAAPNRRMLFNDLTPLCNSVEKLVSGIRNAGVAAEWEKEDLGECYEVRIRVPKRSFHIVRDRSAPQTAAANGVDVEDENSTGSTSEFSPTQSESDPVGPSLLATADDCRSTAQSIGFKASRGNSLTSS